MKELLADIDERCLVEIKIYNSMSKSLQTKEELIKIKSYKRDKISRLKYDALKNLVKKEDLVFAKKHLKNNEIYICRALRWNVRGLSIEASVLKIQLEYEDKDVSFDRKKRKRKYTKYV